MAAPTCFMTSQKIRMAVHSLQNKLGERKPEQKNKDGPANKRRKRYKECEDGEVQEEDDFNRDMENFLSNNGLSIEAKSADSDSDDDWSDLAQVIAAQFEMEDEVGADINEGVAKMVNKLLQKPIAESTMKDKLEKIKRPGNCEALLTPKLNNEVCGMLRSGARSNEIRMQKIQTKTVTATTMIANLLFTITETNLGNKAKPVDVKALMTGLFGVVGLLGSAIQHENQFRKEEIKYVLPRRFRPMCSAQQPVTSHLFGDDLAKVVKDLNETNKLSHNLMDKQPFKGSSRFHNKGKQPFLGGRKQHPGSYRNHTNWNKDYQKLGHQKQGHKSGGNSSK